MLPEIVLSGVSLDAGYGKTQVLHSISIQVSKGELVTVIGANGAGKSTTLRSLMGITALRGGSVIFEGADITELTTSERVARGLCLVPEGRKIFPRLSVFENLELGAYLRRGRGEIEADKERVFSLFPILGERIHQSAGTLSGGEQQMLAIGRAMMSRPRVLLLDEPSMGVAPLLVEKIFETIQKLHSDGLSILLIEQNAQLALSIAARGYVIETGRIVLEDSGKALLASEKVREAYLGEG